MNRTLSPSKLMCDVNNWHQLKESNLYLRFWRPSFYHWTKLICTYMRNLNTGFSFGQMHFCTRLPVSPYDPCFHEPYKDLNLDRSLEVTALTASYMFLPKGVSPIWHIVILRHMVGEDRIRTCEAIECTRFTVWSIRSPASLLNEK